MKNFHETKLLENLGFKMVRVVVLGAGVIGLSSALHLLERFPGELDLTVMAEKFTPNTTSDKSAAIMIQGCSPNAGPEIVIDPENTKIMEHWNRVTMRRFHSIYKSKENAKVQLCLQNGYFFLESRLPDPWYKDDVFNFRHVDISSVEAKTLNVPPNCVHIWSFSTYALNPTPYLRWLMDNIQERGATFEKRKISSFDELSSYDIIINCTGLGSCDLVGDKLMFPVRGEAVLVEAPWIKHWYNFSGTQTLGYIIPRAENVILGGTAIANSWSETPDINTADKVLRDCQEHFPSLCGAKVVGGWAGLRPLRSPVRLESCAGPSGSLLVHCYGHGGQGVVLSWGCAEAIGDIVQNRI